MRKVVDYGVHVRSDVFVLKTFTFLTERQKETNPFLVLMCPYEYIPEGNTNGVYIQERMREMERLTLYGIEICISRRALLCVDLIRKLFKWHVKC